MALKKVIFLIDVPDGKYCWEYTDEHQTCPQFDNEYGTPTCPFLKEWRLIVTDGGVLKPKQCRNLLPLSTLQ